MSYKKPFSDQVKESYIHANVFNQTIDNVYQANGAVGIVCFNKKENDSHWGDNHEQECGYIFLDSSHLPTDAGSLAQGGFMYDSDTGIHYLYTGAEDPLQLAKDAAAAAAAAAAQ